MKLLVVVASATGRTRRMADALAEGAREAGAEVTLRKPEEAQDAGLLAADAVVLGSGVRWRRPSLAGVFSRGPPAGWPGGP